jgi:prepilin-type processing-associated H-X9-DG protein
MLFGGGTVNMAGVSDGTSNTLLVSEEGNFITDLAGNKHPYTSGGPYGWSMGTDRNATAFNPGQGADRMFNTTTIRYLINQVNLDTNTGAVGADSDTGNNFPLNSTHTGGVNAVFVDGHVQFLTNGMILATLAELATRDDGQVIPSF